MYAEERQLEMVRLAREFGRVDVADLAGRFDVTTETVRRDLSQMERRGLVRRVHGGALPVERMQFEPGVAERTTAMAQEKERIAKAALGELPDEGTILLDAGTTTARFAEALPDDRDLTVVTNSLPIAQVLAARPRLTVLTLGGRVRSRTLAQVDHWALQTLASLTVDVGFVASNGLSIDRGLTTPDLSESAVKAAMLERARRVVLLADHTKVGADQLCRFGGIEDVDVLITDSGLDAETAAEIEAAGPRVVIA